MDDEGNWVALESFETYSEAEMNLEIGIVISIPMLM
jgi:hypothetical protein